MITKGANHRFGSKPKMRVHIVCYEDLHKWILGKFAMRMCENLERLGTQVDISKTPDPKASINHHIIYYNYDGRKTTTETVMITHVDTDFKVEQIRRQLVNAEMGICMSRYTTNMLTSKGIPRDRLCYVNPGHDGIMKPRRTRIGITSNVQPSGCKREGMLFEIAKRISPDDFEFFIMGSGWDDIVSFLRNNYFKVEYISRFDRDLYREAMPRLDYYLYMGLDEGSMGFVDALAAGIGTIVTTQGYHLDAPGGITYPFTEIHELDEVFHKIAEEKHARARAVASWTWYEYARKHLVLWECILARQQNQPMPPEAQADLKAMGVDWKDAATDSQ
jgi:hypothetical protein